MSDWEPEAQSWATFTVDGSKVWVVGKALNTTPHPMWAIEFPPEDSRHGEVEYAGASQLKPWTPPPKPFTITTGAWWTRADSIVIRLADKELERLQSFTGNKLCVVFAPVAVDES